MGLSQNYVQGKTKIKSVYMKINFFYSFISIFQFWQHGMRCLNSQTGNEPSLPAVVQFQDPQGSPQWAVFKVNLSFHPEGPATIQDQLTMGRMRVSLVASVTYQLCSGWQAAHTSDLKTPVVTLESWRFCISLVSKPYTDLSNHIFLLSNNNCQSESDTWLDFRLSIGLILIGSLLPSEELIESDFIQEG